MRAIIPKGLFRDRLAQAGASLLALLALPYLVPLLSEEQMWTYASLWVEIPMLVLSIVACLWGLGRIEEAGERRFWKWMAAGLVAWLVQDLLSLSFPPVEEASIVVELARNALYFGFYFFFAIALETRPQTAAPLTGRLRAFDHLGAFVFLFGQLLYFAVIPSLIDLEAYWSSSLLLYVVLDVYLFVRLSGFRKNTADPVWRNVFDLLWVAAGWWLVTDFIEMMMWADLIPYVESGTPLDLLWMPPLLWLILGARSRHLPAQEGRRRERRLPELIAVGPLVLYAMAFPVIHFVAYSSGLADPDLESVRGWTSLGFFLLLMGMTFGYQELLRKETRRLEEKKLETQALVEHQAYHDHLTGLPNRLLLADHLELAVANARRFKRYLALLFLDLDGFKIVNDSLGHAVGDELLKDVAQRLRNRCRPSDTVARLGGDEFVVLADGLSDVTHAAKVARKMLGVFEGPFEVQGRSLRSSASLGVAIFPMDGNDGEELMRNADIAMYQAKRAGRGSYRLFTAAMNEAAVARLALEESLHRSITNSELFLVYQPIVELESEKPVSVEALLRWQHPDRGLMQPDSFIETAESMGLILPMGRMALETACQQLAAWHRAGSSLSISVNASVRQLESPTFERDVEQILGAADLAPSFLEIEITESMAIEHAPVIVPCLEGLRNLGVRVCLDDFGTRYSSLSWLLELPIDRIKIDRTFVQGVDREAKWASVAGAILTMARELGIEVIAEGVERESQRAMLLDLGCSLGQGFLFSRPMVAEKVLAPR